MESTFQLESGGRAAFVELTMRTVRLTSYDFYHVTYIVRGRHVLDGELLSSMQPLLVRYETPAIIIVQDA